MAESNRQRRVFPDAFKLEAVAAVRGGRPVSGVAAELGLPDRLVRSWLRWAEGLMDLVLALLCRCLYLSVYLQGRRPLVHPPLLPRIAWVFRSRIGRG